MDSSSKETLPSETVALRTEGVDRNKAETPAEPMLFQVALRTEGVDRNEDVLCRVKHGVESPSARRAWIEMHIGPRPCNGCKRRPPHGGRG